MLCMRVYSRHPLRHITVPMLGGVLTALTDETIQLSLIHICLNTQKAVVVPKELYYYVQRGSSITVSYTHLGRRWTRWNPSASPCR